MRATPSVPRQVLLFSGHMVDAPDRPTPRFPERWVPAALRRIEQALEQLDAGPGDLAYTQGACGGDLLYTQACLARGVPVQWLQPFADEAEFLRRSVALRGAHWAQRYHALRAQLDRPVQGMAADPAEAGADPFERCNRWLLACALAHGAERLRVIALWNGQGGDGPGGTAHLLQLAHEAGREAIWIDTRTLSADEA